MNQIFYNNTFNQMNTIYVNINVGPQLIGTPIVSSALFRSTQSLQLSPSKSLSPMSWSSGFSVNSFREEWRDNQVIPKGLANNIMFDPIRYKTEMCKNFEELGYCKFGEKCYYAHFPHELKVATYKHKNYKTQLCKPFHSDGFCDFGSRCAFIHSKPDVNQILESFLYSMPGFRYEEELVELQLLDLMPEKRLKVFKKLSSE